MQCMQGRVAVVTGAGRGLGRAYALALARAGAYVLVNDLGGSHGGEGADPAPATSVVEEIRAAGGTAEANTDSVSSWESAARIVAHAVEAFGDVHALVNNAGILRYDSIEASTQEDWERIIRVNLTGPAAMTHAVAEYWRGTGARKHRAIVNASSPAATSPMGGNVAYAASKGGINALSVATAAELAELGVCVNAIAPVGRTRMLDASPPEYHDAMKPPSDGSFDRYDAANVAPLVVCLCSPMCHFTGRVFAAEGDDVYLFHGWSAEHRLNNAGQPWAVDALLDALRQLPRQEERWEFYPGGRLRSLTPADATLQALDVAASSG